MEAEAPYDEFLQQSGVHGRCPAFYLLAAQALHSRGAPAAEVLRAATNALELGAEDAQLLRSVGYFAMHLAHHGLAVALFERAGDLAPEEPQSHLDLAMALFFQLRREGVAAGTDEDVVLARRRVLRRALACAGRVVTGRWAPRFAEVEWPALLALNWIVGYGVHLGHLVEELWPTELLPRRVPV